MSIVAGVVDSGAAGDVVVTDVGVVCFARVAVVAAGIADSVPIMAVSFLCVLGSGTCRRWRLLRLYIWSPCFTR